MLYISRKVVFLNYFKMEVFYHLKLSLAFLEKSLPPFQSSKDLYARAISTNHSLFLYALICFVDDVH